MFRNIGNRDESRGELSTKFKGGHFVCVNLDKSGLFNLSEN
jgi:hypothetical protein